MYKTIELAFIAHLNKKTQSYLKDSLERILTSEIGFKFSFTSIKYNPKIFLDKCYRGRVFRLVLAESYIQMDHMQPPRTSCAHLSTKSPFEA